MIGGDVKLTVIFSSLLILLLIAGVVITLFIANRRHVNQEVKIAQMHVDYAQELRKAEQETQEQVLITVGRELHDNIGQLLTLMRFQAEQMKVLNPEVAEPLQAMDNTLRHTMEEVRRLGISLNSDLLEGFGLVNILQQEVIRLQQLKKYTIIWKHDEEPQLNKDQKVIAFRFFQEALNNIMKHAGGKNIEICLQGEHLFKMIISDDGKGFDLEQKLKAGGGAGLKNMLRRAELAKLKCHITSTINKGTTFTLEQTIT